MGLGAAVGVGIATWAGVAMATHRREAWDSELYVTMVLPAIGICAFALAALIPERAWRWAFAPFAGQAAAAFVQNPTANLLPLGLIVFAVFGAIICIPAYLGAAVGRRLQRKRAG
ncbi:MAG TPA: hypothetical protein VFJ02_02320 [Vicinamibacterales bacterium]|nr:hypothetical protein [Vicinamibacterales bacterium]